MTVKHQIWQIYTKGKVTARADGCHLWSRRTQKCPMWIQASLHWLLHSLLILGCFGYVTSLEGTRWLYSAFSLLPYGMEFWSELEDNRKDERSKANRFLFLSRPSLGFTFILARWRPLILPSGLWPVTGFPPTEIINVTSSAFEEGWLHAEGACQWQAPT